MSPEKHNAEIELAQVIATECRVVIDCMGRLADCLEEAGTDCFQLHYLQVQLGFAKLRIERSIARVAEHGSKHATGPDSSDC